MPETLPTPPLRCADPACGVEFTPSRPWQKYHSQQCRKRHWFRSWRRRRDRAAGLTLTCPYCGRPVVVRLSLGPLGKSAAREARNKKGTGCRDDRRLHITLRLS